MKAYFTLEVTFVKEAVVYCDVVYKLGLSNPDNVRKYNYT